MEKKLRIAYKFIRNSGAASSYRLFMNFLELHGSVYESCRGRAEDFRCGAREVVACKTPTVGDSAVQVLTVNFCLSQIDGAGEVAGIGETECGLEVIEGAFKFVK